MALKGESKQQKMLSAPKTVGYARKSKTWIVRRKTGPHDLASSAPLVFALRDLLHLGKSMREIKKLLHEEKVSVNGTVRKEPHFAVGILDVVDIPDLKKRFIVKLDAKGRLVLKEAVLEKKVQKVSKIAAKHIISGGLVQLTTGEGWNLVTKESKIKVGDSVKLDLPEKKIVMELPLKEGNLGYVVAGRHVGRLAEITEIVPGTARRDRLLNLKEGDDVFQTVQRYVLVVGLKKPEMGL